MWYHSLSDNENYICKTISGTENLGPPTIQLGKKFTSISFNNSAYCCCKMTQNSPFQMKVVEEYWATSRQDSILETPWRRPILFCQVRCFARHTPYSFNDVHSKSEKLNVFSSILLFNYGRMYMHLLGETINSVSVAKTENNWGLFILFKCTTISLFMKAICLSLFNVPN